MLKTAIGRFKIVGELRDAAIVTATTLYVLGYATWSLYAWRYRLGAVRALDAQYFVMGAPVTLMLVTLAILILVARKLAEAWHSFYRAQDISVRSKITVATFAAPFVLITFVAFSFILNPRPFTLLQKIALAIAVILVLFVDFPSANPIQAQLTHIFIVVLVTAVAVFALVQFVFSVYGNIPQALGGGAPRRAQLDVKIDQLSPELAHDLFGRTSIQGVRRTADVWVITPVGDTLLLARSANLVKSQMRLELQREAIVAIRWLD